MGTRRGETSDQLSFNLPEKSEKRPALPSANDAARRVLAFRDAATIAIRREAIERVEASGIFELNHKKNR